MAHILRLVQRKADGAFITTHLDDDLGETVDTICCVHCGMHWTPVIGSGRVRGWCWKCDGSTCGKELCETRCVPMEQMIEQIEARGRIEANMAMLR